MKSYLGASIKALFVLFGVAPFAISAVLAQSSTGQIIKNADGGLFMQEVLPPASKRRQAPQPQNFSSGKNLSLGLSRDGVNVDPQGNIIPLLNNGAPGGVEPFYSHTYVGFQLPAYYYPYGSPYFAGGPYGYTPFYRPFYHPPNFRYFAGAGPALNVPAAPVGVTGALAPQALHGGAGIEATGWGAFSRPGIPGQTQYRWSSSVKPLFPAPLSPKGQ